MRNKLEGIGLGFQVKGRRRTQRRQLAGAKPRGQSRPLWTGVGDEDSKNVLRANRLVSTSVGKGFFDK